MTDTSKIKPTHLRRAAFVYVRQSSQTQLERNTESTRRQYALVERAIDLGWNKELVTVIDEDQGLTGSGAVDRSGFAKLIAEVALRHCGIVLGLEVSRLARNNADWYKLLDLCGLTDTLIADTDGLYHPALFNDRLLLGLKGTMSEAELHIIRARLDGGIRNKAARGELRRGLPMGLVWGEGAGEVRFHADESLTGAIRTVFSRFDEMGSVRQVWMWFRSQNLSFPTRKNAHAEIRWVTPTYTAVHNVLTNPVYAGAYAYGKTRHERYVDENGCVKKRVRHLPRDEWAVLIRDHHEGFIDWHKYEANLARIARNTRPRPHEAGGAVREGAALLQGLATCGTCGRRLKVYYQGRRSTPGYHCPGSTIVNGRSEYCLRVGGRHIDSTVARTFLEAIGPAGIDAALLAETELETSRGAAVVQWELTVERTRYEAEKAERRYRAVEPENRLVARGLESEWESRLRALTSAEAELKRRMHERPLLLSEEERKTVRAMGKDVKRIWSAPTTTDRDRKELLRTLLEEVIITAERKQNRAQLTLRWRGGLITDVEVILKRPQPPCRTDEGTIGLVRRLAVHYADATIAGILARQGRKTANGDRFTASKVGNLRRYWKIPRFEPSPEQTEGELVNVRQAAEVLNVATGTVHRWLADGFLAGEQVTPGAPWRIRITDELKNRFVEEAPDGYLAMLEATQALGVTRQTVLQRVKRGELDAVHVRCGKRKGLRIKVIDAQPDLFDEGP